MEDAVVCGSGPAGLSAALWLGRYRRKTLVIDSGDYRNEAASNTHGYLGLDGATPQEIIAAARRDIARYKTVELVGATVREVRREDGSFVLRLDDRDVRSKRLLLATGVEDETPDVDGFSRFYGKTIFHCSCCDGYEASGQRVAAIGWSQHVTGFALDLLDWGAEVVLFTAGQSFEGDESCRRALGRHDVEVIDEPVAAFVGDDGSMVGLRLEGGRTIDCDKAFFSIGHRPRNALAKSLGCKVDDMGYVQVGEHGETTVEGVYAAGDVTPGEQLIQTATAEGAVAGIACAMSLRGEYTPSPAPTPGPDPAAETES